LSDSSFFISNGSFSLLSFSAILLILSLIASACEIMSSLRMCFQLHFDVCNSKQCRILLNFNVNDRNPLSKIKKRQK